MKEEWRLQAFKVCLYIRSAIKDSNLEHAPPSDPRITRFQAVSVWRPDILESIANYFPVCSLSSMERLPTVVRTVEVGTLAHRGKEETSKRRENSNEPRLSLMCADGGEAVQSGTTTRIVNQHRRTNMSPHRMTALRSSQQRVDGKIVSNGCVAHNRAIFYGGTYENFEQNERQM